MASPKTTRTGVPGRIVRPAKNGKTKIVRTGGMRWSAAAEAVFLEHLAATGNVRASAEASGFSTVAIYNRRSKEAGFAERWAAALDTGVARLEMMLVETASSCMLGEPLAGDHPMPRMTVDQVMNLIRLHRTEVKTGALRRNAGLMKLPSIDEVRERILRKVAALERGRAMERGGASEVGE